MLTAKSAKQGGSNFESVNEILSVPVQVKDTEQSRGTVCILGFHMTSSKFKLRNYRFF